MVSLRISRLIYMAWCGKLRSCIDGLCLWPPGCRWRLETMQTASISREKSQIPSFPKLDEVLTQNVATTQTFQTWGICSEDAGRTLWNWLKSFLFKRRYTFSLWGKLGATTWLFSSIHTLNLHFQTSSLHSVPTDIKWLESPHNTSHRNVSIYRFDKNKSLSLKQTITLTPSEARNPVCLWLH